MGRFGYDQVDNYGQENAGSFFSLKDDGDSANVRFLYNGIADVDGYTVHEVHTDGDPTNIKSRKLISCLRDYNEPLDKCPLCAAGYKQIPKLFIKLYNEDTKEPQIWERGKAYFQRLAGLASHYNPLCNEVVSIERHGKKGDLQTKYEFYPIENSEFDMNSIECADPLGSIIEERTASEMQDFLSGGSFASEAAEVADNRQQQVTRRTPSTPNVGRRAF